MNKTPLFHRGHYNKLAAIIGRRMAIVELQAQDAHADEFIPVMKKVLEDLAKALSWEFIEDNEQYDEAQFFEAVNKHYNDYKIVLGIQSETETKAK